MSARRAAHTTDLTDEEGQCLAPLPPHVFPPIVRLPLLPFLQHGLI
jgi:hypothetical protein